MIFIYFSDDISHKYNSFEEILKLDNYNDIDYIDCSHNWLVNLPELPNSLKYLYCGNNKISSLPELPDSLIELYCYNNNISNLSKLPNLLTCLWCQYNKLSILPKLPNSLKSLWCLSNNLSSLPELPITIINILYSGNPIYVHIEKYFGGSSKKYNEHNKNMKSKFVNKIENWFLDCKYNPKYLYCRKRLMKEYDELYN